MDELTLRLECLRLACTARTGNDVLGQADTYYRYVTRDGVVPIQMSEELDAYIAAEVDLLFRMSQFQPPAIVTPEPDPKPKSANERMNEKLAEGNARVRDKLGLTDAARRT